jgi:L,D-transpeptidase ErfK/SrfK
MTSSLRKKILSASLAMMFAGNAFGATFILPQPNENVVGAMLKVTAAYEDTLSDIGRRNGIGYEEIVSANPGVDPWLPGQGTEIVIPAEFVLPDVPREGIVVNLPEHRLYYFPKVAKGAQPIVVTYPISVGKMDWKTPLGLTRVVDKRVKPSWYPPESVRREHEADGRPLPKIVPPGPDNPLGEYAMRLGIPGGAYLIHGTNRPVAVGMPVTHGCIRMFPEDIEAFFKMVPVNTPVRIVHQALKAGWRRDELLIEVHPPLEGDDDPEAQSLTNITRTIVAATKDRSVRIDWSRAEAIFRAASGVPEKLVTAKDGDGMAPLPSVGHAATR